MEHTPDRYTRHRAMLGEDAMKCLRGARVLLAGVGGLGSNVAMTLARLGVGTLELYDPGILDAPDLNRQILYYPSDLGRPKVAIAGERLRAINPEITVVEHPERITGETTLAAVDICMDCLDSFQSRAALEEALQQGWEPSRKDLEERRRLAVPIIHGGAEGWFGQVSTLAPGGGGYAGLFGSVFTERSREAALGKPIMPHVVALVAAAQVQEFVRWCDGGVEGMLVNRILVIDGMTHQHDMIQISPAE